MIATLFEGMYSLKTSDCVIFQPKNTIAVSLVNLRDLLLAKNWPVHH
ncbi:MAG: hypothetical protein ACI9Y1_002294 [Lentisphaeria bacterium]|jgi:hypothetical protein